MEEKQPTTVYRLLRAQAKLSPDAIAIASLGSRPLTYCELLDEVERVIELLRAMGVSRNDRVATVLPNGPAMAVAFLGVSSRAISAPLNPAYRESEFDFYLSDLNAKGLIVKSESDSPAIPVAQRLGIPILTLSSASQGRTGSTLQSHLGLFSSPKESAQPDDVALVLYTSGTTSRPKRVPLTHKNLLTSAHSVGAALGLQPTDRCLNVMPLYHIHGLVGVLLSSLAAGASVALPPDFTSDCFFGWLQDLHPTWYTAVPTIHQAILRSGRDPNATIRQSTLRFIRSSSAPLPAKVMIELQDLFKVPVIEAYGMTEASHQIASNPLPPYERKAGSVGIAAGSEIAIMDAVGRLLSHGNSGEIVLRGSNITGGYEGGIEANEGAFTGGWFRTGDQGYLDADGYLFLTGRLKEMIKRGGEKISPFEVEAALLDHPAIAEAVAFPLAHETLGEDIAAAVILKENAAVTGTEIQRFMAVKLADFKIPRRFLIIDKIPTGPTGKVQRIRLAEQLRLGTEAETNAEFVGPQTDMEVKLAEIWREVLRIEPVGIHDNFFELGGDSLTAGQIINRVRRKLHAEISFLDFFEAPTVAGIAKSIETSDGNSRALGVPTLETAREKDDLPLSFGQERLWFLDHFDGANLAYNRPANLRFSGSLNVPVLQHALDEIAHRHEALRTHFRSVEGRPIQQIFQHMSLPLPMTDISNLPPAEREVEARRIAVEEAQRPFDLSQGPLMRGHLIRLNHDDHVLLLTVHHIVFDGWSEGILFRELETLYPAFLAGQPSPLDPLPIQYADFAYLQRQTLRGDFLEHLVSYWRMQLKHRSHVLELPTDRRRPALQTFRGARHSFPIPRELSKALRQLGRSEGATLFMTLLAAFQGLLHRYTNHDEILIGCPIAARNFPETERLIGFFVNVLVLCADFSAKPTFRELLRSVRDTTLAALAHQDLPFEKLVEEMQVERDLSRTPLFQVLFQLRNYPRPVTSLPDLQVMPFEVGSGRENFDLNVEVLVRDTEELECRFRYNTDLFDASTIIRLANYFRTLLEMIVAAPDQLVTRLPLLTEVEQHQLLVDWNDTERDYPKDKCIYQLFEEQVARTPDAVALVFEEQRMSYQELNQRSNQLAHYLRNQGVGPEMLVGICVERSLKMVVALLGILKAGGAYVPLDPAYPKERLAFMLQDSQLSVLVTQQQLTKVFPQTDARVVCLDEDWNHIARQSDSNISAASRPSNLAYVLYTSGSTGQPKGVAIEHRSSVAFLSWAHTTFSTEDMAGVLASTSIGFDLSVFELFAPLTSGGKVILVENALALPRLAAASEVTLINTVPSAIAALVRLNGIRSSVRTINLAGEPLATSLVQQIYETTSVERVYDLYGPTEDTTYSTFSLRHPTRPATIGRPIANTEVYILDRHLQPVPIGAVGELCIGGAGLARNYLYRPELTAEKFIPDPFGGEPGARLYKTGDLARYLPDGNIEFLGRLDHQAKIRGFRIELGEIEAVLSQHPGVQDSAVLAREDKPGDKRLVAYIVPKPEIYTSSANIPWAELQDKQVADWETLFLETFGKAAEPEDPKTNTAGVNSSYTNDPLPAVELRDWVEDAASRILSLEPKRVLDIGCGLGRILFRIAPSCSRYWGTDFSQAALDYVEKHLDLLGEKRGEIRLIRTRADNFSEISKRHFNTVVMNGVIQYFPHISHLVKVLEGALDTVEPGGVIFVGDVRSFPLLEAFQLSVDLHQAPDDLPTELLWQYVRRNIAQEEELAVDPAFFNAIRHHLARISHAEVLLKRGWAQNELTRFRYDAILHVEPQEQSSPETAWLDWGKDKLTLASVRERLLAGEPEALGIARVPNARVLPEVRAAATLVRGDGPKSVCELRNAIEAMRVNALHPEAFWTLSNELHYSVDITWSSTGGPEFFDVFFRRRTLNGGRRTAARFLQTATAPAPWRSYAHNPIETKLNRALRSSLRSFIEKKLPSHMIPSAFVVLDALPLTPNGKLDRRALPKPEQTRPELERAFVAPRTAVEEVLARIWAEVLGLEHLSVHDNFFYLGGHSLRATQVISRIRKTFQVELPLRTVFEKPTIEKLATALMENRNERTEEKEVSRILTELESIPEQTLQHDRLEENQ